MIDVVMIVLMCAAWMISAVLAFRLIVSERGLGDKVGGCLLLIVPFFGPFLYQFVIDPPPKNHLWLQARGPRGEATHRMISIGPVLKRALNRSARMAALRGGSGSSTVDDN